MEEFIMIAILIWGILSLILFIKVWIMTNNVSEMTKDVWDITKDVHKIADHLLPTEQETTQNQKTDEVAEVADVTDVTEVAETTQQAAKDPTSGCVQIIIGVFIMIAILAIAILAITE